MPTSISKLGVIGAIWVLATTAHANAVRDWNASALAEVRVSRLGPPVVARALAVAHTCMYDAWTAYDARAIGAVVGGSLRRPAAEWTEAHKDKAVSFAAFRCLVNLFPAGAVRLETAMRARGHDPFDTSTNPATPQGIGNLAARAVIDSRRNDGSNQYGTLAAGDYADYTGHVAANAPMPFCLPTTVAACTPNTTNALRWQPLVSDTGSTQRFIAPHWSQVKPFALSAASQFDALAPLPNFLVGAANYEADVNHLVAVTGALTDAQKLIVEYWADGPASELPPGHWALFAQFVSKRDHHSIGQDAKMFFAMHNASFDAGIVAWHLKRKFDGVRPITAVRNLKLGQKVFAWAGPGQPNWWIPGEKWTPYNPGSNLTPAFPGFISGHSTFSAASAEVLRSFKGSDTFGFSTVIPPDFGRDEPGIPAAPTVLSYATFSAAAAEAGASRLLGGIHAADDNTVGQDLGNRVGKLAWARAQFLFDGGLAIDTGSSLEGSNVTTLTWNHTVNTGNNRLLVVGLSCTKPGNPAQGVQYRGVSLTRLGSMGAPDTKVFAELWCLLSPPTGSGVVVATLDAAADVIGGAVSVLGVDQAAAFGTFGSAAGKSGNACITLANAPAPLLVSVVSAKGDADTITLGAGQVPAWNDDTGSSKKDVIGVGITARAVPLATLCATLKKAKSWAVVAVPLNPAISL